MARFIETARNTSKWMKSLADAAASLEAKIVSSRYEQFYVLALETRSERTLQRFMPSYPKPCRMMEAAFPLCTTQ
jgi:predicted aminopeptidase